MGTVEYIQGIVGCEYSGGKPVHIVIMKEILSLEIAFKPAVQCALDS